MEKLQSVLVITPHPDDAESGAGGTIAYWVKQGRQVILVVCTNGDKGTNNRTITSEKLASIRQKEQKEAVKTLGISKVEFLDFPDQGLEDTSEFREKIVRHIRIHKPEIVATVDPNRRYIRHRDHYITGRVVLDAVFPYARDYLAYPQHFREGIEPHKVTQVYLWGSEEPDKYIDITDTFEIKRNALHCHVSQVGERTVEGDERARERYAALGNKVGVGLAEQFKLVELGP